MTDRSTMDRPVFVSLLAVAVVVAAGLGALGVGTDAGSGSNGGESSVAGATPERTARETSTGMKAPLEPGSAAPRPLSAADPSESTVSRYPPGTSPAGIENPRKLLRAHTTTLGESGFVVRSRASAPVLETGMRIDAATRGGARVAPDVEVLRVSHRRRRAAAAPD